MEYELFFLVPASKNGSLENIQKDVQGIVEGLGGTYAGQPLVQERKLAYEIAKEMHGTYVAQRFTLPSIDEREETDDEAPLQDPIADISRQLTLYKDLVRFMIVKADELPTLEEHQKKMAAQKKKAQKVLKTSDDATDKKLTEALHI